MIAVEDSELKRISEKFLVEELGAQACKFVSRTEFNQMVEKGKLEDGVRSHHLRLAGPDFTEQVFTQIYLKLNGVHIYYTIPS